MTDHLPECDVLHIADDDDGAFCICRQLRACEQRVRGEYGSIKTLFTVRQEQRALALQEARDAVAALPSITLNSLRRDGSTPSYDVVKVTDALAAIDALRGDA